MTGIVLAMLSLLGVRRFAPATPSPAQMTAPVPNCVISLRQNIIQAAPPAVFAAIAAEDGDQCWADLVTLFGWRFDGMPANPEDLREGHILKLTARDNAQVWIELTRQGDLTQLTLYDAGIVAAEDRHLAKYLGRKAEFLSFAINAISSPVWSTDQIGRVAWANTAYRDIEQNHAKKRSDERSIIEPTEHPDGQRAPGRRRSRLWTGSDGDQLWFDVADSQNDQFRVYHALDVTGVVRAETAQRNFVQTLTKTFAQLSVGLAIFDRDRRLALFNPAMIDLTSLSPEFMTARPSFRAFFDELRDLHVMPEPRNYKNWRQQIIELDAAAENGRYMETWSLPSGKTYRVTGRPHPNGAIAFLFEDISAEITVNRRFRQQLDLAQSVIDSLEEGLALFSSQGTLSYANSAYLTLWDMPDDAQVLDVSIADATSHWQRHCDPTPVWGDVRDFVVAFGERAEWVAPVTLKDGCILNCRFTPLQGGATLVSFRRRIDPSLITEDPTS